MTIDEILSQLENRDHVSHFQRGTFIRAHMTAKMPFHEQHEKQERLKRLAADLGIKVEFV